MKRAALLALALVLTSVLPARAQEKKDALARLRSFKTLRWCADTQGGAPYVYQDPKEPTRFIGFEVDLAEELAKRLGLAGQQVVQCDYDKLLDQINRDSGNDADDVFVAINGIEAADEKRRVCELTRPYYVAAERLVVRAKDGWLPRTLEAVKGKPIGTLPATLSERLLKGAGADVHSYTSGFDSVCKDVLARRIDGLLIDEPTVTYYAALESGLVTIDRSFGEVRYAVAVKKGETALADAIDQQVDAMCKDGTLRTILERWGLWNVETAHLLGETSLQPKEKPERLEEWLGSVVKKPFLERAKEYPRFLPQFAVGAVKTLGISLVSFAFAVGLGIVLALSRRYGPWPLRAVAATYIEVFRGTPLLVQLYFIYFALPELGPAFSLSPLVAGILGLALNYAAAEAENYRAGLESVPSGQLEACYALGLSRWQAIRYVIAPQAVRIAIPPATNDFIALLKDSSLVSVITMTELLRVTSDLAAGTRDNRGMYAICAIIYLLLGLPFSALARWVERRMGQHLRRTEA